MTDEESDQVGRFQAHPIAESTADGTRLGHLDPSQIDRVRNHVDLISRNLVELFQVAPDHLAHGDEPGRAQGLYCLLSIAR